MKDDITIQIPKQEDFVAANKRRDKYALTRDIQAQEFNQAIVTREKADAKNRVKCEKCGREFIAGNAITDIHTCPEGA